MDPVRRVETGVSRRRQSLRPVRHKNALNEPLQHRRDHGRRQTEDRRAEGRGCMSELSRRKVIGATTLLGSCASTAGRFACPAGPDERFDFTKLLDGWETISGTWGIEDVPGASRDGRASVQRATDNEYNVIVAPGGPYGDVDVSVRFKPISGWEDASGGIVFRFSEGRYYLVRANATEDNFRLYYYDRRRHMLASASVMRRCWASGICYACRLAATAFVAGSTAGHSSITATAGSPAAA